MKLYSLLLAAAISCTALAQSFTSEAYTRSLPPPQPTDRPENHPLEPFNIRLESKDKRFPKHPPTYINCNGVPVTNRSLAHPFTFYPSHGMGSGLLWSCGWPIAFDMCCGLGANRTAFGPTSDFYRSGYATSRWYVEGKGKKRYLEFVNAQYYWEAHWVMAENKRSNGTPYQALNALWWVHWEDPSRESDIPVKLMLDFPE